MSIDPDNPFRAPRARTRDVDPIPRPANSGVARVRFILGTLALLFIASYGVGYLFEWADEGEDLHQALFFFYPTPILALFASVARNWSTRIAFGLALITTVSTTLSFSIDALDGHGLQAFATVLMILQPHLWLLLFQAHRFEGRAWKVRTAIIVDLVKLPFLIYYDVPETPNLEVAAIIGLLLLFWLQALWRPDQIVLQSKPTPQNESSSR